MKRSVEAMIRLVSFKDKANEKMAKEILGKIVEHLKNGGFTGSAVKTSAEQKTSQTGQIRRPEKTEKQERGPTAPTLFSH